jgi:hypothetical protein
MLQRGWSIVGSRSIGGVSLKRHDGQALSCAGVARGLLLGSIDCFAVVNGHVSQALPVAR